MSLGLESIVSDKTLHLSSDTGCKKLPVRPAAWCRSKTHPFIPSKAVACSQALVEAVPRPLQQFCRQCGIVGQRWVPLHNLVLRPVSRRTFRPAVLLRGDGGARIQQHRVTACEFHGLRRLQGGCSELGLHMHGLSSHERRTAVGVEGGDSPQIAAAPN